MPFGRVWFKRADTPCRREAAGGVSASLSTRAGEHGHRKAFETTDGESSGLSVPFRHPANRNRRPACRVRLSLARFSLSLGEPLRMAASRARMP